MQPNQVTPDPQAPVPTSLDSPAGQDARTPLTIQPLSTEDSIREAADKAAIVISSPNTTSLVSAPVVTNPLTNDPVTTIVTPGVSSEQVEVSKSKKRRISFIIFLVLALAQIYWLGELSISVIGALNAGRLAILVTGVLLSCVVLLRFIQIYRFNGFNLSRLRDKIYTSLAVTPVVLYILCIALLFLVAQLKSFQLGLLFIAGAAFASTVAVFLLIVPVIALGAMLRKRTGFGRIIYLWPLWIFLVAPIIAVTLVGSPQGTQSGIAEEVQLEQVKTNMASYLTDRYGMDFKIQDIQFVKTSTATSGTKRVTAKVSLVKDPSFSYSAGARLYKDVSVSTGEVKEETKYQEDFIGAYWQYGFEKIICPPVYSFQKSIAVTNCTVTGYSLGVNYNDVLTKYRGNVLSFTQLDEQSKALLNFNLTIKTNDDNYLNNVPLHADFLASLKSSIQKTHATSTINYSSNSKTVENKSLIYYGTTDASTAGGKLPILALIYQGDTDSSHIPGGSGGVMYYNTQTGKFDLMKPGV